MHYTFVITYLFLFVSFSLVNAHTQFPGKLSDYDLFVVSDESIKVRIPSIQCIS